MKSFAQDHSWLSEEARCARVVQSADLTKPTLRGPVACGLWSSPHVLGSASFHWPSTKSPLLDNPNAQSHILPFNTWPL